MSASVYIPGQGTWKGTAGLSYAGQPISPDMQLGIASNTKLFVAAVMLKLAENNIISLDDKLSQWLPAYPNVNPNITIRQLLNHTSGISDPLFVSPWMDTIMKNPTRVFTPNEVLGWLGAPSFPAGTSWGYSNVNYIIAGMIAEIRTGYHISRLIRDSLLTPLNLNSTFYDVKESLAGTIAHRWWNNMDYHDTSRVALNTAGGCAGALFSSSGDMAQWYHQLFSGQVLTPASMAALTHFVPTTSSSLNYGLGLDRETTAGITYWGHGGSTWGYRSKMIYDTCIGAVVCGLTNSYPSGMESVTFLVYRAMANHIPGCSGVISGPTTVTQGQNAVVYTVPPIANATSYVWTLPSGATGTSITNSITVNFGMAAISGPITVQGVNSYGPGGHSSLNILVTAVLPVRLTLFDAKKSGKSSLLTWTTATEQNLDRIIIEHSTDGQSYSSLKEVEAAGINQAEMHYSHIHRVPSAGSNYYRLKFIDRDGGYSCSQVRVLHYDRHEMNISIYPNPVSNELIIETSENGKAVTIKIFNRLGQLLYNGSGSGKILIPANTYSPGIYFISIGDENNKVTKKFVKE